MCGGGASPLFATPSAGRPVGASPSPQRPHTPKVADQRLRLLTPGQRWRTGAAGVYLFLPLLAQLDFGKLVAQAGYPGSKMVPAASALLSLLTLKLIDKERRSHIDDDNFDEALGLFAGLNILPKKSFITDYSYRTQRCHQARLLQGWIGGLSALLFPEPEGFNLDFHPIPYRGDSAGLDNHYVPCRGKASPSVLTCFAQERKSRVLCYGNANLARADQAGAVMGFIEFWHTITGQDPTRLFFDSKMVPYAEMSKINQRKVRFVTIRRRGSSIVAGLASRSASDWQRAVIDIPKRRHKRIRYLDELILVRGYEGPIRQIAITDHGREQPTLLLSNDFEDTARNLIIGYAGRNGLEGAIGECVNFFHLDCLASEVRLNVDLDVATTVIANGCYRWLASRLHGYEKALPKTACRKFIETPGVVEFGTGRLRVHFDRRAHNPVIREAALDAPATPIPWIGGVPIEFTYQ